MEKTSKTLQENENKKGKGKNGQDLPPFPKEEKEIPSEKPEDSGPGDTDEDQEEYITEVCKDLISVPFEIWHTLRPKVDPLSELEKKHISKSLARVAIKYQVDRWMKDEIMLFTFLGFAILKRARIKDDTDHSGEKGKGENDPSKKSDKD